MLLILDKFFIIFHALFTLFNMTGWIWVKTRKIHLATITLTAFSWFILGIRYGWGYCFCTDWHWNVREALGNPILLNSYIQFLINEITGITVPSHLVDPATLAIFGLCCAMSVILNGKDYLRWRSSRKAR